MPLLFGNDTEGSTENVLGRRETRPNFAPLACQYEPLYGIRMRVKNDDGSLLESVRYDINQKASDFDEEEIAATLTVPEDLKI